VTKDLSTLYSILKHPVEAVEGSPPLEEGASEGVAEVIEAVEGRPALEIIYVPCDVPSKAQWEKNEAGDFHPPKVWEKQFRSCLEAMPWLSIPADTTDNIKALGLRCNTLIDLLVNRAPGTSATNGDSPVLQILDHNANVITKNAMPVLEADWEAAADSFPWNGDSAPAPMKEASAPGSINLDLRQVNPSSAMVQSGGIPDGQMATKEWVNLTSKGNIAALHVAVHGQSFPTDPLEGGTPRNLAFPLETPRGNLSTILLEAGADVNIVDDEGATPLIIASAHGSSNSVRMLLGQGAVTERNKIELIRTALQAAAEGSHVECAKILIQHGGSVNSNDPEQRSVLHLACAGSRWKPSSTELVEILLRGGAKVDVKDKYGQTPLMYACMDTWTVRPRLDHRVIELLKEYGADTYAKDRRGNTAWDVCLPYRPETIQDGGLWDTLAGPLNVDMSFILGPPGSGKTEQATRLGTGFDFRVYTLESMLKEACELRTGIAGEIERLRERNAGLIPAKIIATGLRSCLEIFQKETEIADGGNSYRVVLDGFPSTREEANEIEKAIGKPHFVISLQTPYQQGMKRLCLDVSGNKVDKKICDMVTAQYKAFPFAFSKLAEYYKSEKKFREFKAGEKEGLMVVFNNIKMLFGYMEAGAIMARTAAGRDKLVTQPMATSHRNLLDAKKNIAAIRVADAAKIRKGTREIEDEVKFNRNEGVEIKKRIAEPVRAACNASLKLPNCHVHKSLRPK